MEATGSDNRDLLAELASAHSRVCSAQLRLLEVVACCDDPEVWSKDGARDLAEWLSARLGISNWAARRWIAAAQALGRLPRLRGALGSGALSQDKVVELCRFATPETEGGLISWARRVGVAAVRRRADLCVRIDTEQDMEADRTRYLRHWWFDDGRRLGLEASLAAADGAVVITALDRLAATLPEVVAEAEDLSGNPEWMAEESRDARRADSLVALASQRLASDPDPDRATVVVHAELSALVGGPGGAALEDGPVIHPETARRLLCDGRLQTVVSDGGKASGIGHTSRTASSSILRLLRWRDRGCVFPGCELRRFLHAHHIRHWIEGGRTEPDNLVLVCSRHHKLVHEYGWRVQLGGGGAEWFRPGGKRFSPGLNPSQETPQARAGPASSPA